MYIRKDDLNPTQYRATLSAAERERQELSERLVQIQSEGVMLQQRIQWLNTMIEALRPLCQTEQEEEDVPHIGAVCYYVLSNLGRAATAPEIRDLIAPMLDLSRYPNPLAVIHTTLGRMEGITRFKGNDGKTYFTSGPPPLPSPEGSGLQSYRSGNLMTLAGLNRPLSRRPRPTMPPPEGPPELMSLEDEEKKK